MAPDTSAPVLLILRLALALSLYGFLAWALLTLWRELKLQSEMRVYRQPPALSLHLPAAEGPQSHRFTNPEIFIGRDPACDLTLEDSTVSAQHARLSYHHSQWWIEDLGSTNGTFLNREYVFTPLVVTSGDELHIGQVCLAVSMGS